MKAKKSETKFEIIHLRSIHNLFLSCRKKSNYDWICTFKQCNC